MIFCPSRRSATKPASRKTARCLETVDTSAPISLVRSPTQASDSESRITIYRREGWASALNTATRRLCMAFSCRFILLVSSPEKYFLSMKVA